MLTGTALDLTPFGLSLSALGLLYWAAMLAAVAFALWLPLPWWLKILLATCISVAFIYPVAQHAQEREQKIDEARARLNESMALFEERCKSGGEKVYRIAEDVQGLMLTNVRPDTTPINKADRNWINAALPLERGGDDYIRMFLYWEHNEDKRNVRGYLNESPSSIPAYRHVDVLEADKSIVRYRLSNPGASELTRAPVSGTPSRYAIAFTNMDDELGRRHWIAGLKVTITDTTTKEIIAEKVWYSIEPGQGSKAGFREPWEHARTCPAPAGMLGVTTRFFVDQVLKPSKGG